jgi:hypothetical protein
MRYGVVIAGLLAAAGGAVAAGPLVQVTPGEWQVHEIGSTAAPVAACVRDVARLVQWRHGAQRCAQVPAGTDGRRTTIYYECGRGGQGQTVLTVENPALVRIQTQGLAAGQPFDLDLEARRVGACRTGAVASR